MSSLSLHNITLQDLKKADSELRKSLLEGDLGKIAIWRDLAVNVIDLMLSGGAVEERHPDIDPENLVRRMIAALADQDFFDRWLQAMSPTKIEDDDETSGRVLRSTFDSKFDWMHATSSKKSQSSWVYLGISLLLETPRLWNQDFTPLTAEESLGRFRRVLWQKEIVPWLGKQLKKDPSRSTEILPLLADREGEVSEGLWAIYWAPRSNRTYTGVPDLLMFMKRLVYYPGPFARKCERHIGPQMLQSLFGAASDDDVTDSVEAAEYRKLLAGGKILKRKREGKQGSEYIRYPVEGMLRALLNRNNEILIRHGLENVLSQAIDRLSTELRQDYAKRYYIDSWDETRITEQITKKKCICATKIHRKRTRCTCPSKTANILLDIWQSFGKSEVGIQGRLNHALWLIENGDQDGGNIPPPDGGDRRSDSELAKRETPGSPRRDQDSVKSKFVQNGDSMYIDDKSLQAIRGITGLQTGEWTREEVPNDVYASWVEALGSDRFEALFNLDQDEPEPTPRNDELLPQQAIIPTVESQILSLLRHTLPVPWRTAEASLLYDGLRWVPEAAGERDIDPAAPSTLPATYVMGNERWRIGSVRGTMELVCLTAGQDPVAAGSIRIEGDDIVVIPAYPVDDTWRAFAVVPLGMDPLDCPGNRIVFLVNRTESAEPSLAEADKLLLARYLTAAWRKAVDKKINSGELASWLYILLTHSEGLLNQVYPSVCEHLRDPADIYVLADLEPGKVAGRIDSMRYVLLNQLRGK